ncbi:MAG TPA: hypothetical protein VJZ76_00915 [Thermoanaerobaculia bacterium]|nr:hypothetical protein [Thermoanaerobaculia bacterium]
MLEIFGVGNHSAAITPEEAEQLAGKPEALAERVYGLGNPKKAKELGNLVAQPDLAEDSRYMLAIAAEEWNEKGCNDCADQDDIVKVTKAINGGKIRLKERREWL